MHKNREKLGNEKNDSNVINTGSNFILVDESDYYKSKSLSEKVFQDIIDIGDKIGEVISKIKK